MKLQHRWIIAVVAVKTGIDIPANCERYLTVREELARKRFIDADALFRKVVDRECGHGNLRADVRSLCYPSENTVVLLAERFLVGRETGLAHLLGQCISRDLRQCAEAVGWIDTALERLHSTEQPGTY